MTVEQPALPRYTKNRGCEDHTYAQVKEITGITDKQAIHKAIDACKNDEGNYKVEEVVNLLITDENLQAKSKTSTDKMAITYSKESDSVDARANLPPNQNANKNSKPSGVIDLTNVSDLNESDDIQKAIAASLQESGIQDTPGILGGQVSREEQDISRVLEQSLIESKAGTKRKRGDIWFVDPLNPHERKRQDNWPIGLKNVGNTCWFSAVIQSLFHLRRFQHLVLNYQPPRDISLGNTEERRNLRFMQELRLLFALMVGSRRKYVDPSKAVDILKEAFSTSVVINAGVTDSQQDVSEFQHKLLEWLEDAFKTSSRPTSPVDGGGSPSSPKCSDNPMVDLFYGRYRADGINEGKGFSNEETFGQFPLQVNGFRDIHESLEAATAHKEIETISSEATQKSGQELWFTRLPPMLTFELSRFQFNQQLGRPEKIHNKIEFPPVLYMDRYLDFNQQETRARREKAKKLKEELVVLQAKLDKFINYGSGSKRFPLQDVLLYALEFAKSTPDHPSKKIQVSQDVEMESPSPNNSMLTDSPVKSPADVTMVSVKSPLPEPVSTTNLSVSDVTMCSESTSPTSRTSVEISMTPVNKGGERGAGPAAGTPASPCPKQVSDSELRVLQDCLHRWRTEVESDVRELQENIGTLETAINKLYSDEAMTKFPYYLHAVLVHEGQAASGHYWAYIYDLATDQWLKFNDITVTEASWEELEKESVGGYHNASAYCLMYIDKSRISLDGDDSVDSVSKTCEVEHLPDELKEIVQIDNRAFAEEIDKWDKDIARKASGGGDADVTLVSEQRTVSPSSSSSTVSTQTVQPAAKITVNYGQIHAHVALNESLAAMRKVLENDTNDTRSVEEAVNVAFASEWKRVHHVVSQLPSVFPLQDPRLLHIVTYLLHCGCPQETLKRMQLEQFSEMIWDQNEKIQKMKNWTANAVDRLTKDAGEQAAKSYLFWHETYSLFRKASLLFITGVSFYLEEKHEMALPYLVHAHTSNMLLQKRAENAGLADNKILAFFLRQCLLHINDTTSQQFEDQWDVTDCLHTMNILVLPCLGVMTTYRDDIAAVEEIREKWCSFLGQQMEDHKIEKLQDFLSKLFEPPIDVRIPKIPRLMTDNFQNLHKQYATVMEVANSSGYVERALKAS